MTVTQALDYPSPESGFRFKSPKNTKARAVALPSIATEALRRYRARQAEVRLLMGAGYAAKLDLVIATETGSPLLPSHFSSTFRWLIKKAGLPICGPHTLRHRFATMAIANGVNPLIVSQALGHSSVSFTMAQYAHILPNMQESAASTMDGVLRTALAGPARQR